MKEVESLPQRSNNLSLKYQRSTPSDYKDTEIRKFEFVAKTQFLSDIRDVLSMKHPIHNFDINQMSIYEISF